MLFGQVSILNASDNSTGCKANSMPTSTNSGQLTLTYPTACLARRSRSLSTHPLALAQQENTPHVMCLYPASLLSMLLSKVWTWMHSRVPQLPLEQEMRHQQLSWVADEHMWEQARASEQCVQKILDELDESVLWFEGYGTDWIKDIGVLFLFFCSHLMLIFPDGFLQPNYLQMCSSKWPFNLHGIKPGVSSQRPTRWS